MYCALQTCKLKNVFNRAGLTTPPGPRQFPSIWPVTTSFYGKTNSGGIFDGHPSKHYPSLTLFNFGDRKGSVACNANKD